MNRLEELQRQRERIAEHLAWLDEEIRRARTGGPPAGAVVGNTQSPAQSAVPTAPASFSAAISAGPATVSQPTPAIPGAEFADSLLAEQAQHSASLVQETRRGCLIYFFAALALLGVAVVLVFIFYGSE